MTLRRMIEFIKSHQKELILFNIPESDSLAIDIAERFRTQNVRIHTERTASGKPRIAVLSDDESVLGVESISTLQEVLDPDSGQVTTRTARTSEQFAPFVSHLKETTFTSYNRKQLLYASREIEDRAHRVRDGTIHAGFQRVSRMADQQPIYAALARAGVEVHAYGIPDADSPDFGSGQIHAIENDELAASWFVVFDGGSEPTQKTALLARETSSNSFFGAWTYDPQLVETVCTYLEQTYVAPSEGKQTRQ